MTEVEAEVTEATPALTPEEMERVIADLNRQLVQAGETMVKFRALVRTEAMAMAEQHNLCSVVESTLRKVGIESLRTRVAITTTIERRVTYEVPAELLDAISQEDFVVWATTNQLPRGQTQRAFRGVRVLTQSDHPVNATMEAVPIEPPQRGRGPRPLPPIPDGYLSAYATNDGRVLHIVSLRGDVPDLTAGGRYRNLTRGAVCGLGPAHSWLSQSDRGEHRLCMRCCVRLGIPHQ